MDQAERDLLIRLDENVKLLIRKVDKLEDSTANRVDALELRVEALEELKWKMMGAAALLAFLVSLALQFLSRLLPQR